MPTAALRRRCFLVQDPDQLNGRVRQHLEERATQPRPQTSLGDDVSDLTVFSQRALINDGDHDHDL
jgi:hypothetical protein